MIASLSGILQEKALDRVVVDVGGVGYELHLSTQTLADLPARGEEVRLLCHTHVREDALQLFGFASMKERQAFELLIAVAGVGPRLALTILSGMDVDSLGRAITEGDHKRLQGIPGVGKKMAERLVVELRERFGRVVAAAAAVTDGPRVAIGPLDAEVVTALVNLGYKRAVAEGAVGQVTKSADEGGGQRLSPEELLRASLSVIAGQ